MMLHCLGTTGFHPSPTRHTACYYLPELSLVLDAGTGIFRLIEELRAEPKESLTLLLSHAHLDHVVGLTFLIDAFATTKLDRLNVIGEAEKLEAIQKHLFHPLIFPLLPEQIVFVPLPSPSGRQVFGGLEIEWFPLEHPGTSLGFSVYGKGKKLCYISDTVARPTAGYLEHIQEPDLLLHECYFDDSNQSLAEKTGHSWLAAVTEVVRMVRPKSTALIHINPLAELLGQELVLSAEQRESLRMCIAEDGMKLPV
ncbi:MAG: ribonuclease Z [bacterium]|nr:ribonuclease Z [bacterium]